MKRRNFFAKAIGGTLASMGVASIAKADIFKFKVRDDIIDGNFIHVVYFWLKDPDDKNKNEQFLKSLRGFLSKVDVIEDYFIGSPAHTPRDVVDNSYSYSLIVTFKSKDDHDTYQKHSAHKKFIADSEHLWTRVQVYDSLPVG